ncbi:MAG: ketoacyl-ACP synthase III [Oceanococcus sp.]|nr:MAG: ketoacyl-ACP synthase III [Oceanococcus sp.]
MSVYLHGLGHFHPENEITNQFLEDLDIGTNHEWIMERVGIESRRTALSLDYIRETRNVDVRAACEAADYSLAQTGAKAAELAIKRACIDKSQIGLVLAGSSAGDTYTPTEAANIACLMELEVPAIDINSACTSFFAGLHMLSWMNAAKLPEFVLLVIPEAVTRTVNYNDRSSAVLWGDGAAAAVISLKAPATARIRGSALESSPAGADKIVVPRTGHFVQQGRAVQMFAIKKTVAQIKRLRNEVASAHNELQFVGHQANLRMLETVCQHADIEPRHHHRNVDRFGNTAGASAASVISQRWNQWSAGDQVAVAGVGAGLTWAGYLLEFSGDAV